MREGPSRELAELLAHLGFDHPGRMGAIRRRAHRLARELPLFDSVWVDALAQARVLTPLQAALIHAGRGLDLRVGPYLLCRPIPGPAYCRAFLAREIATGRTVRLSVAHLPEHQIGDGYRRLAALLAASRTIDHPTIAPIASVGVAEGQLWAASRHDPGTTAAESLTHHGRLPPRAVLEIARQMVSGLAELERAGLCHGDLSASGLTIRPDGQIVLPQPGLRSALREHEGYPFADLPPEDYDYLAPERVADGAPATRAGDIYACACLWWHLLCGRPPIPGGDALTKLRAIPQTQIADVRTLAPDTPTALAEAIAAAARRDPAARPDSIDWLAELLGPGNGRGNVLLRRDLRRHVANASTWGDRAPRAPGNRAAAWLIVAVIGAGAIAAALWSRNPPPPNSSAPHSIAAPQRAADPQAPIVEQVYASPPPQARVDQDLVLGSAQLVTLKDRALRPGQTVRAERGRRATVAVPRTGIRIQQDDLRFEDLDFVLEDSLPPPKHDAERLAALVQLETPRAEFRGCTFSVPPGTEPLPVAIAWTHPQTARPNALALPAGLIVLGDCVFRGTKAGIACRTQGPLALRFANTLCLSPGPLVWLDHVPRADEPVRIALASVTLRSSGPLVQCRCDRIESPPGRLTIEAQRSVFAPASNNPLLSFVGDAAPQSLLAHLDWSGEGSLVTPETPFAQWQLPDGSAQAMEDRAAAIAGLVRSSLRFAGGESEAPAASRVLEWQAPLSSPDPPGVNPGSLPLPKP